jgi:magnesium chelatase accessory protein
MFAARELDFARDGQDWPYREASQFVPAAGIRWHVQTTGLARDAAPTVLFLHGTGASTHSWRELMGLLAPRFHCIALDLPGHGFTERPPADLFTLPGMAHGLSDLLAALGERPDLVIGHSAGAAVMLRFALDAAVAPKGLVSVNGALKPYGGEAARVLSPLARLLFLNPFVPRFFAWQAGHKAAVERLIRGTGSALDAEGIEYYRRLVANPDHVAAALGMMGHWDLSALARDLPQLSAPLLLIAGLNDKAIKAEDVFATRALVPQARIEMMRGLGHLAHEEAPEAVRDLIIAFARDIGALAS